MNGMRRAVGLVVACAWCVAVSGCMAVSATETRFGSDADVVAVDGRVYIINKTTGRVCLVDVSRSEPWSRQDETDDND